MCRTAPAHWSCRPLDGGPPSVQRGILQKLIIRLAAVVALTASNCGRDPEKADRFVPAPELARSALEAVLVDWKAGRPPLSIERLPVKVHVVDQFRKANQELEEFEILGEVPGAAGRCFAVRLKLSQPEADDKVRYIVIGIDPLWVFRQEDFDLMNHWGHPMATDSADGPGSGIDGPGNEKTESPTDEKNTKTDEQEPIDERDPQVK